MKRWLAMMGLCLVPSSAALSLDISSYRQLLKDAQGTGVEGAVARATLQAYLQGAAELLSAMAMDRESRTGVCPPTGVRLTHDHLRAAIDNELRNPEALRKALGLDWEKYHVGMISYVGMRRTFPCR